MKDKICVAIGIAGGYIASLFGGWDAALKTLILFIGKFSAIRKEP